MTGWRTRTKRIARTATDRIMVPYVERITAEIRAAAEVPAAKAGQPSPVDEVSEGSHGFVFPSERFNLSLHELRTVELERLGRPIERVVSVGASGRWYFDWFERCVGPVAEHVGVEAFEPEPPDLPPYVRWIPTTADRFDGIDDSSVDVVFAGQTTEHLWADELAGFLLQARRVLRPDGVLVVDSPNRLVTQHLRWSHGGHTVELSAGEFAELATLAGFRIESTRGLWRCCFGPRVLQLEEQVDDPVLAVRRITDAPDRPDDSFVWWTVATPANEPDPAALRERSTALYAEHWPTRVCRAMWPGPPLDGLDAAAGRLELTSLPFVLGPGRYRFGVRLAVGSTVSIAELSLDLRRPDGSIVHHLEPSHGEVDEGGWTWELDQPDVQFALSLVLTAEVAAPVRLAMPLVAEQLRRGSASS